jgi:hypothetical protein
MDFHDRRQLPGGLIIKRINRQALDNSILLSSKHYSRLQVDDVHYVLYKYKFDLEKLQEAAMAGELTADMLEKAKVTQGKHTVHVLSCAFAGSQGES